MAEPLNEKDQSQPGKHRGEWRRCQTCGAPENDHPYRHPFKEWLPGRGRVIPPASCICPDTGFGVYRECAVHGTSPD